jgi:hypothetical protein
MLLALVLVIGSIFGLAYCWQQGLSNVLPIIGFLLSLLVLFGSVGYGVWYGARRAFRIADEYVRDVASATVIVAKETVEDIPETLMGGVEKTIEKARDRLIGRSGRYVPPWRRSRFSSDRDLDYEEESKDESVPFESEESRSRTDEISGTAEKAGAYRTRIDDIIAELRGKRKRSGK